MRSAPSTLAALCWAAATAWGVPALAADAHPLVAAEVARYELPAADAMHMPTGIAVGADGTVHVVDGVHDRVVTFAADGTPGASIQQISAHALSRPIAAKLDTAGRLWIVDNGSARVLVRNPDGTLHRVVELPPDALAAPPDLTDIAFGADGTLWLVDNDHHRLIAYDPAAGSVQPIGRRGESLGEYQYPYSLAATPEHELFVVDVINGRVQRLDDTGQPVGVVGRYGVRFAEFYRPKGIALDDAGHVWVSDGTLNVVQAFHADGRPVGVLRDESGAVLRFDVPMGLAFDTAGDLYVVELGANRAVRLRVTRDASAPLPARPPGAGRATVGVQSRSCSLCHFEWMAPLHDGESTLLADPPPNPPEHPYVSRAVMCLGCHDGSVGDSRERVWVHHGHRTGIAPPDEMGVPADLPLVDGTIACRTCHSAHTVPTRTTIEEIVFLRAGASPADLCLKCHSDFGGGTAAGMHPLSELPIDMPASLVHLGSEQRNAAVTCLACHTGHGAQHEQLLVLDPGTNDLCLACHEPMQPQLFGDTHRSAHGRQPALTGVQVDVAQRLDTRLGDGYQLLCGTCHVSHGAPTAHDLLAFDPAEQNTCAACHPVQDGVVQSSHDLRTNHPELANAVGITAREGGACAGCHTAHQDGRPPQPTAVDPVGRCTSCHAAGQLAANVTLGPRNHPETRCGDCHDPHTTRFGDYLKAAPNTLCRDCHEEQTTLAGGPHDPSRNVEQWPAVSRDHEGCLACHRPHGDEQTGLYRAGLADAGFPHDRACVACHAEALDAPGNEIALHHPRNVAARPGNGALPLEMLAGEPHVSCYTCHDPHAGPDHPNLTRLATGANQDETCLACHDDRANIFMTGHASEPMREAGFAITACQPCHITHGAPDEMEDTLMWPKALGTYEGMDTVPVADRHCVACHRQGGPVTPPTIASHPDVEMYNPGQPGAPGYLPLFNKQGEIDPAGKVACRTCHLTHGRSTRAPIPEGVKPVSSRELRARAWHVRSFGASNVCTTCHGFDALRRFMYFHEPARRGGPIEGGAGS